MVAQDVYGCCVIDDKDGLLLSNKKRTTLWILFELSFADLVQCACGIAEKVV